MHTEEDRDRYVRVVEEIDTGDREVQEAEHIRRCHRRQRHRCDAEEELARKADEKQHRVHVRRIKLRASNGLAPRQVTRARQDEGDRKDSEGKRGGVEDMHVSPLFVPADQVFGGEPGRHHQELKVEPIRLEPEKQVDAEDHREWTEAQGVGVPPRPREKHLEPIGEKQLAGNESHRAVDLMPVQTPIQQTGSLGTRMEAVQPALLSSPLHASVMVPWTSKSQKSIPAPMRNTICLNACGPAATTVSDRMNARLWPMYDLSPAARNGRTSTDVCWPSVLSD